MADPTGYYWLSIAVILDGHIYAWKGERIGSPPDRAHFPSLSNRYMPPGDVGSTASIHLAVFDLDGAHSDSTHHWYARWPNHPDAPGACPPVPKAEPRHPIRETVLELERRATPPPGGRFYWWPLGNVQSREWGVAGV